MSPFKIVAGVFFAAGLAMLAGTAYLYNDQQDFLSDARSAQGEVIQMVRNQGEDGSTFAALVRFTDDNQQSHEFVDQISSNPPRHSRGQRVNLLYAPDNPSVAIIDDFWGRWGFIAILGPMGAIFAMLGGGLIFFVIRSARMRKWLRANGTPIAVEFLEVERDTSQSVNGRHPYRVVAQGKNPFSGKLEQFLSDPIWVDPTDELAGKKLKVFIDPNKPSRYSVDIDRLIDRA